MMTCEIMKDLLPAYASGECSDETRRVVDDHITTCASCSKTLRAMTEPAVGEDARREKGARDRGGTAKENGTANIEESVKEMTFKKGFKKIRRRWLISILCVLLIIPLAGLGYLGYNETRGEGYTFSNLKGMRNVDSFMKCIQAGDYAGAIKYYDIASMYPDLVREDDTQYEYIHKSEISVVEIGGSKYCDTSPLIQSKFEPYKQPGTDAPFWAEQIIENANSFRGSTLIPEQAFAEAARIAEESMGVKIIVVDLADETPDSPFTYMRYHAQDGKVYYRPTQGGRLSEVDWMSTDFVPESIFSAFMQLNNSKIDAILLKKQAYRDLGIDRYTDMVKEKYIAEMTLLSTMGMKIKSYSLGKPYRRSESSDPSSYSFDTEGYKKEYWYVDVAVEFSNENNVKGQDRVFDQNQVFTFRIDGDYLTANGSFAISFVPEGSNSFEGSKNIFGFIISPDPRVLEDDPHNYSYYQDGKQYYIWILQ